MINKSIQAGKFLQFTQVIIVIMIFGCSKNNSSPDSNPGGETSIVNLTNEKFDEYIGRGVEYHTHMLARDIKPGQEGWLGNPHPIGWCDICGLYHTRDECIEQFKQDFYKRIKGNPEFGKSVFMLKGKRLGCYCKPKNCHGDVIKKWIDSQNNEENFKPNL